MHFCACKAGIRSLFAAAVFISLISCGAQPQRAQTLGDIDKDNRNVRVSSAQTAKRSADDVKRAYYDYIADAAQDDRFRLQAATRIAELELSLEAEKSQEVTDSQFTESVQRTIGLLEETLRDFPDAEDNDHSYYQLAKAYDQVAESAKAVDTLELLATRYPDSPYFVEAKFRIAESAFIQGKYFKAENAYTDVIRRPGNEVFYEKALFKRGWTRYKQEMYTEALNDFFQAISHHQFAPYETLERADQELFEEYFRGVGLAFSYLGGAEAVAKYHEQADDPVYVFKTYDTLANLYLKQERYSDTVSAYETYIQSHPSDEYVVQAGIKILAVWKNAGYFTRYVASFEDFFRRYSAESDFWRDPRVEEADTQQQLAYESIRQNTILLASYYHNQYLKGADANQFVSAQRWYQRYLEDYQAYARQDQIYPLYAELLSHAGKDAEALEYYELAAFDGDIVLDKESAYASVYLTSRLYQQAPAPKKADLLHKHLDYAQRYSQLYPSENHTPDVVQNAVQLATKAGLYQKVISLADLLPDQAQDQVQYEVGVLKAQAHFDLNEYDAAELIYQDLLAAQDVSAQDRPNLTNKLAVAIYKQGEEAKRDEQNDVATAHFLRVYHDLPSSELAPTALYDGIALLLSQRQWSRSIDYLNQFKDAYPSHPFQSDVAKKLSFAYLQTDRGVDAAREFERISDFATNRDEKMAALWQAAELYFNKHQLEPALRAYKEYAHTYKRPYAENVEAMNYIIEIYKQLGERQKMIFWLNKIVNADKSVASNIKTDRTQYIAAKSAHSLAFLHKDEFDGIRLQAPLANALKAKKAAMQNAVRLFGRAASYGHEDFVTQSTLSIAEIYQSFAKALLESERPDNLNEEQLEQYEILLEDQAFPFDDKAIEFYEANVARISQGVYDEFIQQSLTRLQSLFPARYGREAKVERWIESL